MINIATDISSILTICLSIFGTHLVIIKQYYYKQIQKKSAELNKLAKENYWKEYKNVILQHDPEISQIYKRATSKDRQIIQRIIKKSFEKCKQNCLNNKAPSLDYEK